MDTSNYAHGQYEIGDKIKAFDFQPIENRKDRYIVGEIKDIGYFTNASVLSYKVEVETDTLYPSKGHNKRNIVFVPLGLAFGEFDERVTKIN